MTARDQGRFRVEPGELDGVIVDLERCETNLSQLTDRLEGHIRQLHLVWEGLAATAQAEAHQEWTRGMLAMRQALADLRSAARIAHSNYTGAAATNVQMWEQLR